MPLRETIGHTTAASVVFTGPYGVGKSTAVAALSDIRVTNTDVSGNAWERWHHGSGKQTTTVGVDLGEWHDTPDRTKIALAGIPGQRRFQHMRDDLVRNATGVVLMTFGDRDPGLRDFVEWLDHIERIRGLERTVIGVTRLGEKGPVSLDSYRQRLHRRGVEIPVMAVDPRLRADVAHLVAAALSWS